MLAHFISGPQVHTYDATTVLLSVFQGKSPAAKSPLPNALIVGILTVALFDFWAKGVFRGAGTWRLSGEMRISPGTRSLRHRRDSSHLSRSVATL